METRQFKSYSDLSEIESFKDRFLYLKLSGRVGDMTFGGHRKLCQDFYRSRIWKSIREKVIIRDEGCDLGIFGREIYSRPIVHHIVPITIEDIINENEKLLYNLDNLILVSKKTHDAIHYGGNVDSDILIERHPNDTRLW